MLSDIATVINVISTAVIVATLVFVVRQTSILKKSINQSTLSDVLSRYQEVNRYLLEDEDFRTLVGYSKPEVQALILLNQMEALYVRRRVGLLDDSTWRAEQRYIYEMAKIDAVQAAMARFEPEYRSDFVAFVRSLSPAAKSAASK